MGEYAQRNSDGQKVKIGTCQSMTDLRPDQLESVSHATNSLDVNDPHVAGHLRFRFPYPDEDGTKPGDFEDFARAVTVPGLTAPETVEHRSYCNPETREGVQIVAQRAWEGALVLTLRSECQCRTMWSETDEEGAAPVLDAIRAHLASASWEDVAWWSTVGARIVAGYTDPPRWVARAAAASALAAAAA